jgi:hypothetical protein
MRFDQGSVDRRSIIDLIAASEFQGAQAATKAKEPGIRFGGFENGVAARFASLRSSDQCSGTARPPTGIGCRLSEDRNFVVGWGKPSPDGSSWRRRLWRRCSSEAATAERSLGST